MQCTFCAEETAFLTLNNHSTHFSFPVDTIMRVNLWAVPKSTRWFCSHLEMPKGRRFHCFGKPSRWSPSQWTAQRNRWPPTSPRWWWVNPPPCGHSSAPPDEKHMPYEEMWELVITLLKIIPNCVLLEDTNHAMFKHKISLRKWDHYYSRSENDFPLACLPLSFRNI